MYVCRLNACAAGAALLLLSTFPTSLYAVEKAALKAAVPASQQVGFDVYLPIQNRDALDQQLADLHNSSSPSYHKWLTPEQFNARFAASAAQMAAVQKQLAAYGLTAAVVTPHRLHVSGASSAVEQAFSTQLMSGVYADGKTTTLAVQPLVKTGALAEMNAVVTGLSGTIRMRSHSHQIATPQNRYSSTGGYWFDDLKQAYSYPSYQAYTGKGVTIGILMANTYNPPDMTLYFSHEKLATPNFSVEDVDGGGVFNPSTGDSVETHLDLQQSGGMAPKAHIILYNLPDLSDAHILDGLSQIVSENKTDVVSMSFGGAEVFYTAADNDGVDYTSTLREEDDLFAQGNAQGITFIASSGDSGALDAVPVACLNGAPNCGSFQPSVEFPASSPHVVGVGGTNLVTTYTGTAGDLNSAYVSEEAYADPVSADIFYGTSATGGFWGSGGGDSILFKQPLFQALSKTGNRKFRTVPDLALHMGGCPADATCNPDDSYDIAVLQGQLIGLIGTSAAAPDFAGLTALTIERFGSRLGNENHYIYALALAQSAGLPLNVFKTGIPGFNGLYATTRTGYNRVLGNGTLNGKNFLLAPFVPSAGIPQTVSNP